MAFQITATRNSTWIAQQALNRIGAASVDNPSPPEDIAIALDKLDAMSADLTARGVVYVADLDTTPSAVAHNLAYALAWALIPDFGEPPEGTSPMPPLGQVEANLRRITTDQPSFGPLQASYF